jgi:hypothetical protein
MSTTTKPSRKDQIGLLVFALILLVYFLNVAKETFITPGNMWVPPIARHQPSAPASWSLSDVYLQSSSKPSIATQDNKLIVLGSTNISLKASVMALGERSGQLLWSMGYSGLSMAIADSKVIVGGIVRVLALDIQNGRTLWSTFVKANVVEITPQDEYLYVYGTSGGHDYLLNASNGKAIRELEQANRIKDYPSLHGIQGDIISNVEVTSSSVYALTKDGSLLRLNRETGQQEILLVFTDAPFATYQAVFPYYVTVDPKTNILFVYLGDSAQLYAFQLPNS